MRASARHDSGFSLLELVLVCFIMGVVLTAAWTMMTSVSTMSNQMSARAVATDDSEVFIENIGNELQQADSLKAFAATSTANADAQGAFYDIRPRQIGFYSDVDHDGRPERIAYYAIGASLYRAQASAANTTYPYSWAASSTPEVVVAAIDPSWDDSIFRYYGTGGWPPTPVTDASRVASITVVSVEMRNVGTWGDQSVSYSASSTLRVRAIGNGF